MEVFVCCSDILVVVVVVINGIDFVIVVGVVVGDFVIIGDCGWCWL